MFNVDSTDAVRALANEVPGLLRASAHAPSTGAMMLEQMDLLLGECDLACWCCQFDQMSGIAGVQLLHMAGWRRSALATIRVDCSLSCCAVTPLAGVLSIFELVVLPAGA